MQSLKVQSHKQSWLTVLRIGLAFFVCQAAFQLGMTFIVIEQMAMILGVAHLVWVAPGIIAWVAYMWTRNLPLLPPQYVWVVLPVVLCCAGIATGALVTGVTGWNLWYPFKATDILAGLYGLYGISAGLLWVGCLVRTWSHTQTIRAETQVQESSDS